MAAGDSITAIDSVAAGTTTIQPSSGDVWRIMSASTSTNVALQAFDGTQSINVVGKATQEVNAAHIADNSEYLRWNNTGCSAEDNFYGGQKVVE